MSVPRQDQTGLVPYAEIVTFLLKPEARPPDMESAIKKIVEAAKHLNPLHGDWHAQWADRVAALAREVPEKSLAIIVLKGHV